MLNSLSMRRAGLCGLLSVATLAFAGGPALCQDTADGFTVRGAAPRADQMSAGVSYADLDLTTRPGRAALHRRVEHAAVVLCRRLGADSVARSPVQSSCEDRAVLGAMRQERQVIAAAGARDQAASSRGTAFALTLNGEEGR